MITAREYLESLPDPDDVVGSDHHELGEALLAIAYQFLDTARADEAVAELVNNTDGPQLIIDTMRENDELSAYLTKQDVIDWIEAPP